MSDIPIKLCRSNTKKTSQDGGMKDERDLSMMYQHQCVRGSDHSSLSVWILSSTEIYTKNSNPNTINVYRSEGKKNEQLNFDLQNSRNYFYEALVK